MAHRELVSRCWGCNEPLPRGPFDDPHRTYHDAECRALHDRTMVAFEKRCPQLPGWGRNPVRRPANGRRPAGGEARSLDGRGPGLASDS